uniref:Uncharacterized protein n=1 Tax=Molossus molossus TaxID=27622 RepID=A0A7J8HHV7_MOLMO|nr:hypothetical protein HJG59_011075 [Molossus molossus]
MTALVAHRGECPGAQGPHESWARPPWHRLCIGRGPVSALKKRRYPDDLGASSLTCVTCPPGGEAPSRRETVWKTRKREGLPLAQVGSGARCESRQPCSLDTGKSRPHQRQRGHTGASRVCRGPAPRGGP